MPVYVLGGFVDIDKLVEICSIYGIHLIEDSKYIKLTGLHFHIGSQILNMDNFKDLAQKVNIILSELYDEGVDIKHINVGGGLGIDYDNPFDGSIPDFKSYFEKCNLVV